VRFNARDTTSLAPCISWVELGVDCQLSGYWCSYGKRLPGIDRWLQSPAFGQVGSIPSIPFCRLRSYVSTGLEVWSSGSTSQCLVSKSIVVPIHCVIHWAGFELFFNVLVYPFLLFGTQTLEIRERSRRWMWTQLYDGLCHGIDCRWCPMSVPKYPCRESDR
jgi:hypothetical protein